MRHEGAAVTIQRIHGRLDQLFPLHLVEPAGGDDCHPRAALPPHLAVGVSIGMEEGVPISNE